MGARVLAPVLLVGGLLAAGCGPTEVFGTYMVDLTLFTENCPDVDEGDMLSNLSLDVTQDERTVLATAVIIPVFLEVDFLGETTGRGFMAESTENYPTNIGGQCQMLYTYALDLDVDGALVDGTMDQVGVSNGSSDCTINECTGVWNVLGTRTCGADPC